MLAQAGVSMITVHGRMRGREDRRRDGSADLDAIATIVQLVKPFGIPVITNGNVRQYKDVIDNLRQTQASGIMIAEQILRDPAIFARAFNLTEQLIPYGLALIEEYFSILGMIKDQVCIEDGAVIEKTGKFKRTYPSIDFER